MRIGPDIGYFYPTNHAGHQQGKNTIYSKIEALFQIRTYNVELSEIAA